MRGKVIEVDIHHDIILIRVQKSDAIHLLECYSSYGNGPEYAYNLTKFNEQLNTRYESLWELLKTCPTLTFDSPFIQQLY